MARKGAEKEIQRERERERSTSFKERVAADEEQCTQIVRACQDNFVSRVHAAASTRAPASNEKK